MKRLLVYVFIVLGLGLTFSVNANSAKYSYDKDFICFQDVGNGTVFVGTSKSGWATEVNNIENLCSIFVYEDKHPKKYKEITDKWPYLLKINLGNHKTPVAEQYLKWWKLRDKKFLKISHGKILLKEKTKIVKNEPSIKKKIVKKSSNDWRKNLAVEGTVSEKKKTLPKKNLNKNLSLNDYTFYAFEYPNSNTLSRIYGTRTYNNSEAILLLENGDCKFGSRLDKLIENTKYETSFDLKCSYRVVNNNIHARVQDRINISIYPKEMKVRGINSIGKTISRVTDRNETLYLAKTYKASKLIAQIGGTESKTKIAKNKTSQTKKIAKNNKTINYSDGSKYIGETQNGKPNGQGTFTWPNGDKYVGNFSDNKIHGQGTLTYADGNKFVGEFKNSKSSGKGTFTWSNGDKYVGNFSDNKIHGQGTLTFAIGGKYVGEFKNGKRSGKGTFTMSNGDKYVGNYLDNKFNGNAYVVYSSTGNVLVGIYKNGKIIDGEAELYDSSGKYLTTSVYKNNAVIKNKKYWLEKRKKTLAEALEEKNLKFEDTETVIVKKEQKNKDNKNQKVAKVSEENQKEIKIKTKELDTEGPKILIAETITVDDSSYRLKGKVSDTGSDKIYLKIDGQDVPLENGRFNVPRYSPIDEKIKLVAKDKWGNESTKMIKVIVDIKYETVVEKLEPLNPTTIKAKNSGEKVALIIGIENYIEAPKANYANLDAEYFSDYARKVFGVKKQNINLLVDENASFVKTNKALTLWLKSKIKANQTDLVVFFAGHGLASNDGKELYLLPQDSDPNLLDITALSRTKLFQTIIDLKPKSVTMFLDTCYSGVSRDEQMLLASARPIRIVADEQEGIPDNFTIFTASQVEQISSGLKEANHGIFSYYLMKGLEGNADANKDKKITNGELLAYMDENVSQKAAELGRPQNPSLAGDPDKVLISYR